MTKRFSDEAYECSTCAEEGFDIDQHSETILDAGKFQGEVLPAFHAYHVMLDGGADEDDDRAWLIGNMICEESESGFVGCDIYETEEEARATWDRLVEHGTTNQYDAPLSIYNA